MATPSPSGAEAPPTRREIDPRRPAGDHDEMPSPRTSFCLLEAASDDRDSAVSAPVAVLSPHGLENPQRRLPSHHHQQQLHYDERGPHTTAMDATFSSTTGTATAMATAPVLPPARRRQVSYTHSLNMTPTSSTAATIASAPIRSPRKRLYASTSTVSIPPLMDPFENDGSVAVAEDTGTDDAEHLDSMRALFRLDSSVYANPDNIAPSLETSLIMGESQIVGANGTLGSLYPGKRRQRRATDAISLEAATVAGLPSIQSYQSHHSLQDHYGAHRQQHLHHTGDTVVSSTPGGESPCEQEAMGGGSDDYSARDTSMSYNKPVSGWRWLCCCWPARRPPPVESKETLTLTQFARSLWQRLHMTWDSYFLFFTLALAVCSIPLASGLAVVLRAADTVTFRARCEFREGNVHLSTQGVSTAMLASVLIPTMNHVVLLFVSLWIAIKCSYSRKRVLKSSPSSMHTTLTSAFMLPCFEFMWYTISFLNLAGVVLYAVSFNFEPSRRLSSPQGPSTSDRLELNFDAAYPCDLVSIPFTWMLQLLPFLMAQHSISHEAVRRAIVYSGVICLLIIVLQITLFKEGHVAMGAITICVHVMLLSFYCWAKFLSHARSSFDFFFVIAILDSVTAITVELIALASADFSTTSPHLIGRSVVMSLDAILTVAMLLSLRADTRYWLGIDDSNTSTRHPFKQYMRHLSERGMITNFSTRTSVYDVHRMIEEHRNCVVDFSALKLECVIAQGATSIVMRGLMRSKPIALKIYTSVQVTDEEVRRFSRETALNVQLSHPNIVKFHGLCVVPPSISLVFEFCEYGGLDGVLGNGSMHSLSTKLRAWLDACRAVAYLHSFSPPLLHRDIKTDNFLVGQDFTLKLADFGEANLLKPRTDGTMTIAGTVDYMAPEMILGGKTARYGTGVDVYSLVITLWQIMVPDRSPWEGRSHLEVYNCVTNGERPPLLPSIPSGCAEILEAGWVANPSDRVAVEDIISKVHQLWLLSTHQKTLKRTK